MVAHSEGNVPWGDELDDPTGEKASSECIPYAKKHKRSGKGLKRKRCAMLFAGKFPDALHDIELIKELQKF